MRSGQSPEEEGEANELVDRIRRVAENLDADRLNERELPGLSFDAWRLTEIAKARTRRDRKLSSLMAQIKNWEERHSEGICTAEAVTHALAALKTQVEHGAAKQNTVTAVLDLAELLLSVEARCRETQKKLNRASMDADFATARQRRLKIRPKGGAKDCHLGWWSDLGVRLGVGDAVRGFFGGSGQRSHAELKRSAPAGRPQGGMVYRIGVSLATRALGARCRPGPSDGVPQFSYRHCFCGRGFG